MSDSKETKLGRCEKLRTWLATQSAAHNIPDAMLRDLPYVLYPAAEAGIDDPDYYGFVHYKTVTGWAGRACLVGARLLTALASLDIYRQTAGIYYMTTDGVCVLRVWRDAKDPTLDRRPQEQD